VCFSELKYSRGKERRPKKTAIYGGKIDKFAFFVQESSLTQLLEFPNLVETPIISFSFDPEGVQVYY